MLRGKAKENKSAGKGGVGQGAREEGDSRSKGHPGSLCQVQEGFLHFGKMDPGREFGARFSSGFDYFYKVVL